MFENEENMSLLFERYLKSNFGNSYLKEYDGLFGIPDFLLYIKNDNETKIVSFELKLKNWKRAAKQAFRYKSFSDKSFVVISADESNPAIRNIDFFEKYNIGLAKFNEKKEFEIVFKPKSDKPYSSNLNQRLIDSLVGSRKKAKNTEVLL